MATALARKDDAIQKSGGAGKELLTQERVTNFIQRVRIRLGISVKKQQDLSKKIGALKISELATDQKAYDRANDLYRDIKGYLDEGLKPIEPLIGLANNLHKGLTGAKKQCTDLARSNQNQLAEVLRQADDKIRRDQEERDRQVQLKAQEEAARERQKREKEEREAKERADKIAADAAGARRKADEALEAAQATQNATAIREAEKAANVADRLEVKAETAQSEAEIKSALREEPIITETRTAAPRIDTSSAAVTWVDNWVGEADNVWATIKYIVGVPAEQELAHPELAKLITFDQDELDLMADAQKEAFSVPGCKAVNKQFKRSK